MQRFVLPRFARCGVFYEPIQAFVTLGEEFFLFASRLGLWCYIAKSDSLSQ